jgi:hypothetical protein
MARRSPTSSVVRSLSMLGVLACGALPLAPAGATGSVDPQSSPLGVHDLYDVSALSATDAWAVGSLSRDGAAYETWIQHWDGERWDCVGSHSGSGLQNALYGVGIVATDDVWAVGSAQAAGERHAHTLVEHWDGSRWAVTASPRPSRSSELRGVSALARDDLWAVGSSARGPLTLHYDGTDWRQVAAAPHSGPSSTLRDVTALAGDDVWAVGSAGDETTSPLAEHWNGKRWSSYDVPAPTGSYLTSVSGTAADDVWAVGVTKTAAGGTSTLIEHWDGIAWTVVPSPDGDQAISTLTAVTAIAGDDVWAVGFRGNDHRTATFTEHWDGAAWGVVDSADGSPDANHMYGVAATSSSDVLTVGSYAVHGKDRALTERWDGAAWAITP